MRLTTKGRFAVTAMIDVALHGRNGPITLSSISQRQRISLSYLEQLFGRLRRHALVESTRGPGGGYSLARKASAITVADIVFSIEDGAEGAAKSKTPAPGQTGRCEADELWAAVHSRAVEFLDSVSLQSLVDEQIAQGVQVAGRAPVRRAAMPRAVVPPMRPNTPNSVFALGRLYAKR